MKNIKQKLAVTILMGMSLMYLESCKEDELMPLTLISAATDLGVDLKSSTPATNIPVNASFVITFDKEIDMVTANTNTITMKAGEVNVPTTIEVAGATVTMNPNADLEMGTDYTVFIAPGVVAVDGAPATEVDFTFKTIGRAKVTPPQSIWQLSYFTFSGNMKDAVGTHTPANDDIRNLTYAQDRFGYDGAAGSFNGSTTLVEIPDAHQYMSFSSMTVSTWIKPSASKNGQFVMGLAAWKGFHLEISEDWSMIKIVTHFAESGGVSDSEDVSFSGNGLTKDNGGWQGCTFNQLLAPGELGTVYLKDKWVHVIYTYDANTQLNTMYLNGEKVLQYDFSLWPTTDLKRTISGVKFAGNLTEGGNKLALGFIQGSQNRIVTESWADPSDVFSNHFTGLMDDLRIFRVALTAAEVKTLHTAEKQ